ncbi:DNA replication/repair protein RecF [Hydrocarboniphaga sp.]|uniref:DNA replication/repair protein RecF n=1 Tax=Hydrocarboniphaga sp. TaxID=2033016 RepID=UPI002ABC3A2F|nr:DNA replication/repair protein RecF [Hydrocarboniphaga sp.]MDZ4080325.1 DNA replication/repair protein RecF [Hydrocarboniphaga sp.]
MTRIARFKGENLRLYSKLELTPHERLNLIVGSNAAGKTALLEGLYILGRARSFRATDLGELAGDEGRWWHLFAELVTGDAGWSDKLGAGWSPEGQQLRLNGQRAKSSELARKLPIQLIDPVGHRLVEDGPGYRRSYLDWGVFHVEHHFFGAWQRYQRALKQRNQALRLGLSDAGVSAWDSELAESGGLVTEARKRHVQALAQNFEPLVEELLQLPQARLEFQPGWSEQRELLTVLKEQLLQHRRLGVTSQGPQRAELKLSLGSQKLRGRVSRGQQKLLVAALVLAQCQILTDAGLPPPVILVDDFGAELSAEYQSRLAAVLNRYPGQLFITAFERPNAFENGSMSMFHVEHGYLTAVN